MKTIYCNNCGKQGHQFQECKMPITSIGIIMFRYNKNNELEYLLIRRKDTFGFVDFIRCKYPIYNEDYLLNIIDEMTLKEKEIIRRCIDSTNHDALLNENSEPEYNYIFNQVLKSNYIRNIQSNDNLKQQIITLMENSNTAWEEAEWGFPKGRRSNSEKDIDCALREFEEETGIPKSKLRIIDNIIPYDEIFIGSNYKSYKHKYYLAHMNSYDECVDTYQKSEVSKMQWMTYREAMDSIRGYNLEKKNILSNINKVIREFRLYM